MVSYTIIGGIVGALGSVVSFSGWAKGIVAIFAGIFMVIMGLNMLGLFPWLRRLAPRMPKIFVRKINNEKGSHGPFIVGLLNGLMPCGPLQAMQLYALSTGSFVSGALSMLVFSLGVLMFQNGFSLSGFALPTINSAGNGNVAAQEIVVKDGVQQITSELTSNGYPPITVTAGIPVKWTLHAAAGTVNGCNGTLVIPDYNIEKKLAVGGNIIEFTPDKTGVVP